MEKSQLSNSLTSLLAASDSEDAKSQRGQENKRDGEADGTGDPDSATNDKEGANDGKNHVYGSLNKAR